jgi:hypothetical protein
VTSLASTRKNPTEAGFFQTNVYGKSYDVEPTGIVQFG